MRRKKLVRFVDNDYWTPKCLQPKATADVDDILVQYLSEPAPKVSAVVCRVKTVKVEVRHVRA